MARHLADAPIIMAAVDLSPEMQELAEALRNVVRRVLELEPKARVACVNVLKRPRIGIDFGEDEQGRSLHVLRLVALKHWARPLGLGEGRVTYTVLESPEPAGALLDYARQAQVDHIVIGARERIGCAALSRQRLVASGRRGVVQCDRRPHASGRVSPVTCGADKHEHPRGLQT